MAGEIKHTAEKLESLLKSGFCTEREAEVIQARLSGLPWTKVAEKCNLSLGKCYVKIKQAEDRCIKRGWAPEHDWDKTIPDGYQSRGVSTLYDADGTVKAQWVKSEKDRDRQKELLLERIEAAFESGRPPFKPTKAPARVDADHLNLFTITDFHIGMLAWGDETGADWDTDIAASVFLNAITDMLKVLPKSGTAMLAQLGDFLHFDGLTATTPASGHILDADTRYARLVDVTMVIMEQAIRMLLKHHDKVIVLQAEGNHDESGSVWLRKHCKHLFKNEPRVEVDDTEFPYYAHLFGSNLIAFHHGHKMKMQNLPKLFSSEPRYRKLWGQADRTYVHTGHFHHEKLVEDGGAIVRQHPTLASRDAYAARGGWVSESKAKAIVYHKDDGEVAEYTVRPRVSE